MVVYDQEPFFAVVIVLLFQLFSGLQSQFLTQGALIRPQRGHSQPYSMLGFELLYVIELLEVAVLFIITSIQILLLL